MLGAGKRTHRIRIFDRVSSVQTSGANAGNRAATLVPVDPPARWGDLKSVSSPRELEIAKTFSPSAQYIVTVLYDNTLNHLQNVIIDDVFYAVSGVIHDLNPIPRETYLYVTQLVDDEAPQIIATANDASLPQALPFAIGV